MKLIILMLVKIRIAQKKEVLFKYKPTIGKEIALDYTRPFW